ncbi:MAG: hypothetical protein B6I34_03445 [Anaerolineaceae bacterium 4572_32.1]|nr:MAG: hypothetical protein B6I34_03445 [Anaerolineaceae bacterium 4572_32.1]
MRRTLFLVLLLLLVLVAACGPAPTTPVILPSVMSDREAILALMAAEAEAAVNDDAGRLLELWAADALIRDANHTPDNPIDDHTWIGRDAILSRYLTIIFPLHLTQLARSDIDLTIEGKSAILTATTIINEETSPQGEQWTFARIDGNWRITSIIFNLEPR